MGAEKALKGAEAVFLALLTIGLMGLLFLIIYGNLSTNLGFADQTTGFNNTEAVINNVSAGFGTFFGFSNTLFTIAAIVLLIFMLVGLLAIVMAIAKGSKGSGFTG
ncbi:hypothetical protein LCGC14_1892670 [marine sediment metagenome]|uniref:Uncharacterized protein n=1 Tax=marine sediment metagenome TaxID=412755 RepID=A0A0F9FYZ9_9ZZZZ